jgi:DNA primase
LITRATIDRIMQTAIIEEVIGDFVHLKKSGSSYRGLSPFSSERTPSFFVVPSKGIYKDFSSGKGGNIVDFLMEHERMSYPEALRWLAARYQIPIEEDRQATEKDQEERTERENLSVVSDFAHRWFQAQLHETEEGQAIGLSYFHERGFRDETIKKFQLGYCPDRWDQMSKAALEAGYNSEYLLKSGLSREKDGNTYDFFRGRVIFPIHNISGKVIAFAGRTLKAEKEIAKYFNSPESELYHKSQVLFGLHLAKNAIIRQDMSFLVEGYTDVISLHQAGIENAVASSGTSLTEGQIRLIKRYSPNVTILYDGDAAGIKASFRGIDMLLQEGLNVRVVLFPDGDDPDSFARKHSSTEIQEFIALHSKDFIRFKTALLLEESGSDPVKRAGLIRGIVESIALVPDGIQRSVYLQDCSGLLHMQEQVLINELNKVLRSRHKKATREELPLLDESPLPPLSEPTDPVIELFHQEKDLIRLMLLYGEREIQVTTLNEAGEETEHIMSIGQYLIHHLKVDDLVLETPVYARILNEYNELLADEQVPETRKFSQHPDSEISSGTTDLLATPYLLSENWSVRHQIFPETEEMNLRKAAKDCLYRLKLRKVMRMIDAITDELKTIQSDDDRLDDLLREKKTLDQIKSTLANYFGTVLIS